MRHHEREGRVVATVLVTDDAKFMRMRLRKIIEGLGLDVLEAGDGEEAVRMYKEHRPSLVLLDITMPTKDGLQALKEILAEDPNAKVVMCSALAQQTAVVAALKLGARDFIVKPPDPGRVVQAIKRLM